MPKTTVQVNVNFDSNDNASPNPDPVVVSRALNNGITWLANQTGYTFTGIAIQNNPGDFGTPQISTTASNKSQMTVTDSVADYGDYSYTLLFTTPSGGQGRFDPTIKNEQ